MSATATLNTPPWSALRICVLSDLSKSLLTFQPGLLLWEARFGRGNWTPRRQLQSLPAKRINKLGACHSPVPKGSAYIPTLLLQAIQPFVDARRPLGLRASTTISLSASPPWSSSVLIPTWPSANVFGAQATSPCRRPAGLPCPENSRRCHKGFMSRPARL